MTDSTAMLRATEFLAREALALDMQRWDEWLALFHPDAVFWMPAWKSETEMTADPDSEMSLFYIEGRANLEDRVWRLKQQRSAASAPILRTAHGTSNVVALPHGGGQALDIHASWTCHAFNPKRNVQNVFFGRSEYHVLTDGDAWRIGRKKIILMNDYIPTMMDFYCC